jgi:hypothetical protein
MPSSTELNHLVNSLGELVLQQISCEDSYRESRLHKCLMMFGLLMGPLASATVAPYAYQFGESLAKDIFSNPDLEKKILGGIFATCGTIGVSAVGSFICSEQFPIIAGYFKKKPFDSITEEKAYKISIGIVVSALAILSNIPGTYLCHKALELYVKESVILFDISNFFVWTVVGAWSIAAIPSKAYNFVIQYMPSSWFQEIELRRRTIMQQIVSVQEQVLKMSEEEFQNFNHQIFTHSSEDPLRIKEDWIIQLLASPHALNGLQSQMIKKLNGRMIAAGSIGIIVGLSSTYFYIPAGYQSGKFLADLVDIPKAGASLGIIIAIFSFASQGFLNVLSTSSCFDHAFNVLYKKYITACRSNDPEKQHILRDNDSMNVQQVMNTQQQENNIDKTTIAVNVFIFIFAIFSSAHRTEITADYVSNNFMGKFLIALSMFGLCCTNFWGITSIKDKLFGKSPLLQNSFLTRTQGLVNVLEVLKDNMIQEIDDSVNIRRTA